MNTPIDSTAPRSTTTPSTTSERAPMKQSSSMMTGPGTNSYLVGRRRLVVLDPGPDDPVHRAALVAANKDFDLIVFAGAGHGIGDTKTKQFESLADMLSFGLWQTDEK